ncbi:FlgN protein [Paraliobacillus sp. PM-2]|uniref:flagellar protein FlgN n=1 Tax=Paraliobacillus sp. PM-2 TaxID=1462524 RepID=UPI00061C5A2C|nr:flagellar protein FlgN [Paraliobacillus sp. PM-2]CQR46396.1 FlgN protein [Paraliobacillus sp. PM-2]
MLLQTIQRTLEQLVQLHQSLHAVSVQKTEALKAGEIDQLQELLKKEKKHINAINQTEQQRMEQTNKWAIANGLADEPITVTTMLEHLHGTEDGQSLEQITTTLTETLVKLKQQEALNQQLTQQSLQFVQLSMDMIAPTINTFNYGNKQQASNRSVFDSKA